jgi:hypothetical protein
MTVNINSKWPKKDPNKIFEVRVSKKKPDTPFITKINHVLTFNEPGILFDTVMVHENSDDFKSKTVEKSYTIYLKRSQVAEAKEDGINQIKKYRKEVEGIV